MLSTSLRNRNFLDSLKGEIGSMCRNIFATFPRCRPVNTEPLSRSEVVLERVKLASQGKETDTSDDLWKICRNW